MNEVKTCVGAIAGSFGVNGEVRLKSFCSEPSDISDYNPLTSEDGSKSFRLEITGQIKTGLSAKIDGIVNKEQAEQLKGTRLYAERHRFPTLNSGEYYHADLIGLKTKDVNSNEIGKVEALHDYGAGPILEIYIDKIGSTVLIPFTEKSVPNIDLKEKCLIIDLPETLK